MAKELCLKTFTDERGNLTIIEKIIPFSFKRVFYIYGVDDSERGGHRHHETIQAAVCLQGSCVINNNDGRVRKSFLLDSPDKCLLIEPEDYHTMTDFTEDAILMVLASTYYDYNDYIFEDYPND